MRQCKDNAIIPQFIPLEVKNNTKRMAMEQGLYAQVIMLCRKYLKLVETDGGEMKLNSISKVGLQDHNVGLILT